MAYLETLSVWREERDPAIVAELLDEAKLAARAFPVASQKRTTPDAFQQLWMRTAETGDAAATPWLASTLTKHLETATMGGLGRGSRLPVERWNARTRALLGHAPNPVLTLAGLRVLREVEFGVYGGIPDINAIYAHAFELVRAGGHTDIHADVAALIEQHEHDNHDRVIVDLVAPLRALLAELTTPSRRTKPRAKRPLDEATLREAVAQAIDDDAPRLVYADWLTERGDPLGELIVLQCQQARENDPKRGEKLRAAAASLVSKYKALWLGELAKVLTHVEMRRGFLTSFALGPNHLAHEKEWERLARDPLLRTVEAIAPGRSNKRNYALFVGSPEARNLRVLHHVGAAESRAIAGGPERTIRTLVVPKLPAPKLLVELFASKGLAHLRRLELDPATARSIDVGVLSTLRDHLAKRPIANLRTLGVSGNFQASGLLSVLEDLVAMPLEACEVTTRGLRVCIRGSGADRELAISVDDQAYPNALPSLPFLGGLRFAKVTLHGGAAIDPTFAAAFRDGFPNAATPIMLG